MTGMQIKDAGDVRASWTGFPCAVTRDQLRRQVVIDSCAMHDGRDAAAMAIQKDPVRGRCAHSLSGVAMPNYAGLVIACWIEPRSPDCQKQISFAVREPARSVKRGQTPCVAQRATRSPAALTPSSRSPRLGWVSTASMYLAACGSCDARRTRMHSRPGRGGQPDAPE